jgi:hypothetical protein
VPFELKFAGILVRVPSAMLDESFDGLTYQIEQCKNSKAYRTIVLGDAEGREALRVLRAYVGERVQNRSEYLFHSKRGTRLLSSNVLSEATMVTTSLSGIITKSKRESENQEGTSIPSTHMTELGPQRAAGASA